MSTKVKLGMSLYVILFGIFCIFSSFAQAQDFPTKPITLVIPKGAGGTHDLTARAVTSVAMDVMGQPIVILLKPGGGGAIASDIVAKANPDGYTLLYGDPSSNASLPALKGRSKGPDDLDAVCQLGVNNSMVFCRAGLPYKNFKEMVQWAKSHSGELKYASVGALSTREIEWKELMAEMDFTSKVIPYNGGKPALIAVLGGHADISSAGIPACAAHLKAGKLRGLYIISDKRDKNFPDIPTSAEVGIKSFRPFWRTIFAPKGTPQQIINKLAADFQKMLQNKSVAGMLARLGDDPQFVGPDEFTKLWRDDYEYYKKYRK